jgi:alcohol dehydrogenase (cytochrome c)
VTAERLKNPEPGNWLMIRRTYDGWGYSPLDQITPANVKRLKPVWVMSTNEGKVH